MLVSYTWLQSYFKSPIPSPEEVARLFTFHVCEIESITPGEDDTVLDVKIMPDRAHYALCHEGVARELAALIGEPIERKERQILTLSKTELLRVEIKEPALCRRYVGRIIENVTVKKSESEITKRLASIDQRSINNLVDMANYVMFDIGQPLHVFDAKKIKGGIIVRKAVGGEKIVTLDNQEVELTPDILVIADEEAPLAIAGIKGGKKAEVDEHTTSIVLEAAHFDPVYIRKASQRIGIKTDASKRYEYGITPEWAARASDVFAALLAQEDPKVSIGSQSDVYLSIATPRTICVTAQEISRTLGITIDTKTVKEILTRLNVAVEEGPDELTLSIPPERLDLTIPEDIVEEVGRVYGYDKITSTPLPATGFVPALNKTFFYIQKIRSILVSKGFSEVYTYSLRNEGEVKIHNPLASDKAYMRKDLRTAITESLEFNARHAEFLGMDQIKIFEIGNVFSRHEEHTSLSIGVKSAKKIKVKEEEVLTDILSVLSGELGTSIADMVESKGSVCEINLDTLVEKLPDPQEDVVISEVKDVAYKPISPYPYVIRDIAVFVPDGVSECDLLKIINEKGGPLLLKTRLFDVFKKQYEDGSSKTSYAYRLIFQSHEKTLTDEEVNAVMESMSKTITSQGWEVR